jgi:hypothetical protein
MIKNNANYQQQVHALKKEKEKFKEQCDLTLKEIQTNQEKMNMVL